jgi:membrane associated rhomboid family serine protease
MGLYDRDYYRRGRPTWSFPTPRTAVGALLLINIVVYLVEYMVFRRYADAFIDLFALSSEALLNPLRWYQFITYGFLHAYRPEHVILNMFGLWMFGRDIEELYGSREFLRLYLAMVFVAGLVWSASALLRGEDARCMGASGAVAGMVILFACHFPRRELALFFVIPVPAWIAGILMVAYDAFSQVAASSGLERGGNVAYLAHLGGAAFAFTYYYFRWNFGRLFGGRTTGWWQRRPKIRIHTPKVEPPERPDPIHEEDELDRILQKISREGESSLTRQERRILQDASRRYQKRRHDDPDE